MNRNSFKELIFNPYEISDEDLIANASQGKLFQVLGGSDGVMGAEFVSEINLARKIRYILYLYDKNSPLWQTDPDIVARKRKAAHLAGWNIADENVLKELTAIFRLRDPFVTHSVTKFIRYQNSSPLQALMTNEQVLFDMTHVMMESLDKFNDDKQKIDHFKTKTALLQQQDNIMSLIEKYKTQIWKGDEEAYEQTMELEFGKKVSPEQIAQITIKRPTGYEILR